MEQPKIDELIPQVKLGDCNVLFLDISSTCTGFAVASVNFVDKSSVVKKAGAIWFNDNWTHQQKYSYLFNAVLSYFEVVEGVDLIVHETYSVNRDKMSGVLVIPEMVGAIKVAAEENRVRVVDIPPQTWRSQLGMKPIIIPPTKKGGKAKRDYKTPCKDLMNKLFGGIPERSMSNITMKERNTPSDLYDALGVCLGWLRKNNIIKVDYSQCKYNDHVGALQ